MIAVTISHQELQAVRSCTAREMMKRIRPLAAESRVRWRLESLFVEALLASRRGGHVATLYSTVAMFLQYVSYVIDLWYGAQQVLDGAMTTGQLIAFATVAGNVFAVGYENHCREEESRADGASAFRTTW